jgi:ferredoxin
MPTVTVLGKTIKCQHGANLRQLLLDHKITLYNGKAQIINCRGIGSCGTCAVAIEGDVSSLNWKARTRLSLPPHSLAKNLHLACQTKVLGDISVTKYSGFWGQGDNIISTAQ